jgi:hypothetical protein
MINFTVHTWNLQLVQWTWTNFEMKEPQSCDGQTQKQPRLASFVLLTITTNEQHDYECLSRLFIKAMSLYDLMLFDIKTKFLWNRCLGKKYDYQPSTKCEV